MSLLSGLFGGGRKSPANAANQYLNQIPDVAHKGYDPYVNAGADASGKTKSLYESLMQDPTAFVNKLMEGYKPSEGYQFQKDQLAKEMSNTAAAGGVAGTPMDQLNQAENIQGLLGKDMQQFLQNIFGVFNTGLQGEEGIATRGYDATKNLTDILGGALNQQGGMAYKDQVDKNQNQTDLWNMFGKAIGGGLNFASKPSASLFGKNLWGG